MLRPNRIAPLLALAGLLGLAPLACHDEGPAEKAGKQIDEAFDKLTHPNEGALEKAGRKVDEAIDDTTESVKKLGEKED